MFHRIIFLSLIVSSLSCNFNRLSVPFCFHRSWTSLAGVLKNVARIKHFIRLHIVITETIKKQKNNNNNFVIMLKRNSILKSSFKHSTTLTARPIEMRTSWPYGWFWKWSSWILTECNLSWKFVKYRILLEVCMINSTVSPQMWCIKIIKGWFTHPQICWQEFVK